MSQSCLVYKVFHCSTVVRHVVHDHSVIYVTVSCLMLMYSIAPRLCVMFVYTMYFSNENLFSTQM